MAMEIGGYDHKQVEESVLSFWNENKIFETAREKNTGKTPFYFLQGPPYTSGRIHIGHAWNNSAKDVVLRFKRMRGFDVWDRAGYDMHGLPTAHKVEKKFGLKTKEDILEFGMDKFVNECMAFSKEMAGYMNQDLKRLGVWMDFENAYLPITNEFIEGEWWLIKKAHEKGRLYEGKRTLGWCASCATALAKHEQEYKNITDTSIFVKFPVLGVENEYLIIWTTTPWTIPFNLAVMANPEVDYVKVKVDDEVWIMAKALTNIFLGAIDKKYEMIDDFKGSDLEGLEYKHPFENDIDYQSIKESADKTHSVILSSEYVDTSCGTGLVHCAPGCGPEDYEVGHKNGIPPFNNLTERGIFPDDMGTFSGKVAKTDDKFFIEELERRGVLIHSSPIEHDYAHCERCHNPVIFRTTKQWFFKVEDLKKNMVEANSNINWVPESGKNAFNSWLENLRDNSITKQRFWGTPVPIWRCQDCGEITVVGSAEELKELSMDGKIPDNLHRPFIDEVKIKCSCGGEKNRIPDILDVWVDAGTAGWNCLYYPKREDHFKRFFPADFILEAKEQVRGWFNLLMISSMIAFEKPSFKNVYMHGMITDVDGVKMSKSLGNVISPYELIDKYGADTLRAYMTQTNAGEDIKFSWDEAKLKNKNLGILWNVHKLLIDLHLNTEISPDTKVEPKMIEGKFMISRLNSTIKTVTSLLDQYRIDEVSKAIDDLYLELSRTYIQMMRDKSYLGSDEEKSEIISVIYSVVINAIKLLAPYVPFITEKIFLNLKGCFTLEEKSIHHSEWPPYDDALIDETLEQDFEFVKSAIGAILATREKANVGVRWPLGEAIVKTDKKELVEKYAEIIKSQTNIKQLRAVDEFDKMEVSLDADYKAIGKDFGKETAQVVEELKEKQSEIYDSISKVGEFKLESSEKPLKEYHIKIDISVKEPYKNASFRFGDIFLDSSLDQQLETEGFAREITRRIQVIRKDEGLNKRDPIILSLTSDDKDLMKLLGERFKDSIAERVGASSIDFEGRTLKESREEQIKGKKIMIHYELN